MKEKTIEELQKIAQDRILYPEEVRTKALLELARREALKPELYELFRSHVASEITYRENVANDNFSQDKNIVDNPLLPVLYSQKAIFALGRIFTVLPGAILLHKNLKTLGKSEEGQLLLPLSLLISILTIYLVSQFTFPELYIGFGIHIIGNVFILNHYRNKCIGANFKHQRRKISLPLVLCISFYIFLFFTLIEVYNK